MQFHDIDASEQRNICRCSKCRSPQNTANISAKRNKNSYIKSDVKFKISHQSQNKFSLENLKYCSSCQKLSMTVFE